MIEGGFVLGKTSRGEKNVFFWALPELGGNGCLTDHAQIVFALFSRSAFLSIKAPTQLGFSKFTQII